MNTDPRKSPTSVVNSLFLLTLPLLAYAGAIGFGTVWLRHQISVTANANKTVELKMVDVQRRAGELSAEIARAMTPAELLRQNGLLRLNLVRPREEQVLWTPDDVEARLRQKRYGQILTTSTAGVDMQATMEARH